MKSIYYLALLILFFGMMACKNKDPEPEERGLAGTWIMFQRQYQEESKLISLAIPSSPSQTIKLLSPHQLSTVVVDDSTLAGRTYFEFGGGGTGIVGPYILFKKSAESSIGHMFYYNLSGKGDTLRLFEFGQPKGHLYGFRHL